VSTIAPAEITRQPTPETQALPHAGAPGGNSSSQTPTILGVLFSLVGIVLLLAGLRLARAPEEE
jgi:hypothetical protein